MAGFSFFTSLFSWLTRRAEPATAQSPSPIPVVSAEKILPPVPSGETAPGIAWGSRISEPFKRKALEIARRLEMDPNHLMAIMAFETGRSFDPSITNHAGSGATGLIQFMPATARGLGTTTFKLATMSAVDQLDYVEKYLAPYAGKMGDLPSAYMAVLYPRAVDKAPGYVLFRKGSIAYKLNQGLDVNNDGLVTKAEAAARVAALLAEGLRPGVIG